MADLNGTAGSDTLGGTILQDLITSYGGDDTVRSGDGDDIVSTSSGNDIVLGGLGNDTIILGTGDDWVSDGNGNDMVDAGEGNDTVVGSHGDDIYVGGKGFDTLDYSAASGGIIADLSKSSVNGMGADTVSGFEHIVGTAYDDSIKGSKGADVIEAGEGDNYIRGYSGVDDLTGGTGSDTFAYKAIDVVGADGATLAMDRIHGFEGNDHLDIRGLLQGLLNDAMTRDERAATIDDNVHLTDTSAGTILQVKIAGAFVDVALLTDYHATGANAAAWAADGMILA